MRKIGVYILFLLHHLVLSSSETQLIITPNRNIRLKAGAPLNISCQAPNSIGNVSLSFIDQHDSVLITDDKKSIINLSIPKVFRSTTFTCKMLPANVSQPVRVNVQGPGSPPIDIVIKQEECEIVITWSTPLITNGAITDYTIYYTDAKNVRKSLLTWNVIKTQQTRVQLNQVKFGDIYYFRILPHNSDGPGIMSKIYSLKTERIEIPSKLVIREGNSVTVKRGVDFTLTCSLTTNQPLTVSWMSNEVSMSSDEPSVTSSSSTNLVLSLKNVQTSSNYTCLAKNISGTLVLNETVFVTVQGIQKPSGILYTVESASDVQVEWSRHENPDVQGYVVFFTINPTLPTREWEAAMVSNSTEVVIKNLHPNTTYYFKVVAFDRNGPGEHSDISSVITQAIKVFVHIQPPSPVIVDPMGRINLTCTTNQYIDFYIVWKKNDQVLDTYSSSRGHTLIIDDVRETARYECQVISVDSVKSAFVDVVVKGPGSPPENIEVYVDDTWARLSWFPPKITNGNITCYTIYYTKNPHLLIGYWNEVTIMATNNTQPSATIGSLEPGTLYYMSISGNTHLGRGVRSSTIALQTNRDPAINDEPAAMNGVDEDSDYETSDVVQSSSGFPPECLFITSPLDVMFLLDASDNMRDELRFLALQAMLFMIENVFEIGEGNVHVAFVQYNNKVESVVEFGDFHLGVEEIVNKIHAAKRLPGLSYTDKVLKYAKLQYETFGRSAAVPVTFMFTNGHATIDADVIKEDFTDSGISVVPIGLTASATVSLLEVEVEGAPTLDSEAVQTIIAKDFTGLTFIMLEQLCTIMQRRLRAKQLVHHVDRNEEDENSWTSDLNRADSIPPAQTMLTPSITLNIESVDRIGRDAVVHLSPVPDELLNSFSDFLIYYTDDPSQPIITWDFVVVDKEEPEMRISDLDQDTSYTFCARARNEYGLAPWPSDCFHSEIQLPPVNIYVPNEHSTIIPSSFDISLIRANQTQTDYTNETIDLSEILLNNKTVDFANSTNSSIITLLNTYYYTTTTIPSPAAVADSCNCTCIIEIEVEQYQTRCYSDSDDDNGMRTNCSKSGPREKPIQAKKTPTVVIDDLISSDVTQCPCVIPTSTTNGTQLCPDGFLLQRDKCRDVNECAFDNGRCSHGCVNTNGGYYCACPPGMFVNPEDPLACMDDKSYFDHLLLITGDVVH